MKRQRILFNLLPTDEEALRALRTHRADWHAALLAHQSSVKQVPHLYETIGETLGIPSGTAKSRVNRAKWFIMKYRHDHGFPTEGQTIWAKPIRQDQYPPVPPSA